MCEMWIVAGCCCWWEVCSVCGVALACGARVLCECVLGSRVRLRVLRARWCVLDDGLCCAPVYCAVLCCCC